MINRITFACCIEGGSFMPEGIKEVPESAHEPIISQCRYILKNGFDFTECGASMLVKLTDSQFRQLLCENKVSPLKIKACNSLVPPELKICGPDADIAALCEYVDCVQERMEALGICIAVFGSGGARSIPEGFDRKKGSEQIRVFLEMFAKKGKSRGVRLAIEPLRKRESNIFNTITECAEAARETSSDGVMLLADSFHMSEEGTDPDDISLVMDRLIHCHISEPITRAFPGSGKSNDVSYNPRFAEALIKNGYEGTVSVECQFSDFINDVPAARAYLDKIFGSENR